MFRGLEVVFRDHRKPCPMQQAMTSFAVAPGFRGLPFRVWGLELVGFRVCGFRVLEFVGFRV